MLIKCKAHDGIRQAADYRVVYCLICRREVARRIVERDRSGSIAEYGTRKAETLSNPGIVSGRTCLEAETFGTVPRGTVEAYSRIRPDGLVAGMYAVASTDHATGQTSDPFGRTAQAHDAAARRFIVGRRYNDAIDQSLPSFARKASEKAE